jgi:6-phosphogluconate dehydrogenase
VPTKTPTAWVYSRFASRDLDQFADKLLSAMRRDFGGHEEVEVREVPGEL